MIGAKKNAVWSVRWSLHCFELPASPWFSFANSDRDGHPPSAATLARSNLIRLSPLDWPSWLLLPAAWALSCHLLVDHPVSLHIVDRHWWKLWHPAFYFWSSFASHTQIRSGRQLYLGGTVRRPTVPRVMHFWCMALATFWHLLLLKLGLSTELHLYCLHLTRVCGPGLCRHPAVQTLATCQATTWLVVTRPAAGHPSSVCRKLFISPILPFVLILLLVVSFDLDLKLNHAFESISHLLRAHRPPCILHWFYKTPLYVMCVHR